MYKIMKSYHCDKALRDSFNRLAEKTFGLNFEGWYQNGFWGDNYEPYSVVADGEVVANVSVNRTDLVVDGARRRIYQLGTVMTEESRRRRGLIRTIMEEVEKDLMDADGVYLFANDSVVEFYPKFGFRPGKEYGCTRAVFQTGDREMRQVPMEGPEDWAVLERAMEQNAFRGGCDMVGNPQLIFFYMSQFMRQNVWYCEKLDAWAIAEIEDGELLLHNVFSPRAITLEQVTEAFGREVKRVTLGFSPAEPDGWELREHHEADCNFFARGDFFREFEERKLRIPTLAHA